MAADLGGQAQDIADRALDQAGATAKTLQQEARSAGDYLSRGFTPLTTLLAAGSVGYALAYLIHHRRPARRAAGCDPAGSSDPAAPEHKI